MPQHILHKNSVSSCRIEIQKVDYGSVQKNKGLVLKVVDEALLNLTGGIVQGMSGSPIIQDGKLIGAVTHVFINDPTRGYGSFRLLSGWSYCGSRHPGGAL